jgi:hypothetical protein
MSDEKMTKEQFDKENYKNEGQSDNKHYLEKPNKPDSKRRLAHDGEIWVLADVYLDEVQEKRNLEELIETLEKMLGLKNKQIHILAKKLETREQQIKEATEEIKTLCFLGNLQSQYLEKYKTNE